MLKRTYYSYMINEETEEKEISISQVNPKSNGADVILLSRTQIDQFILDLQAVYKKISPVERDTSNCFTNLACRFCGTTEEVTDMILGYACSRMRVCVSCLEQIASEALSCLSPEQCEELLTTYWLKTALNLIPVLGQDD